MSKRPRFDPAIHDENPEWTAEDFARARSADENLPPELLTQFRAKISSPRVENPKVAVKLRLDGVVVEALLASGPGWQTRVNDLLKSMISSGKVKFETPEPKSRKRP